MRRYHTVSCSVTGYRKQLEGLACEDATRAVHTGNGTVIAVADGHGDRRCLHAAVGARLATEAACGTLKRYLRDRRAVSGGAAQYWNGARDEIAREIVKTFATLVLCDYGERYPDRLSEAARRELEAHIASYFDASDATFTPAQLRERYENKKRLDSALVSMLYLYGTTVRATVLTERYLFNCALGDGDSLAIVDGRVEWLLPKTAAYECETASLCEPLTSSPEAFEFSYVELARPGDGACDGIGDVRVAVTAVVLATDGLRNSFFSERQFEQKLATVAAGGKRVDNAKLKGLYRRLTMESVFQDDISTVIAYPL